jgi:putative restriction endonuclease
VVKLYVGITDKDWFRSLAARAPLEEVNFWQPGGSKAFRALKPGELFLFKLHAPLNFIVGGGLFAHDSILPTSIAWDAFGESNGANSLPEMRARIAKYRRAPPDCRLDYRIGCRILEMPFFLEEDRWIPVPASWAPSIQQGKSFEASTGDGRYLWDAIQERLAGRRHEMREPAGARFGTPTLITPRLGQGSFRIVVTDTYQRRCAVTGERTLPALEAAHIRPYAQGGAHEVSNGVLFRSDIHKLFDRGYATVTPAGRFEVSRRIKEEFENGRWYYALQGTPVFEPKRPDLRPSRAALDWHNSNVFLG